MLLSLWFQVFKCRQNWTSSHHSVTNCSNRIHFHFLGPPKSANKSAVIFSNDPKHCSLQWCWTVLEQNWILFLSITFPSVYFTVPSGDLFGSQREVVSAVQVLIMFLVLWQSGRVAASKWPKVWKAVCAHTGALLAKLLLFTAVGKEAVVSPPLAF